ncbi:MAG: cytochrome c oxidase accessory protein CcoG [Hyphomicrobiales bacterium]
MTSATLKDAPLAADAEGEPLYAAARRIYPQKVSGAFRRLKWLLLVLTLGIYYLLPFVRWHRGPSEPTQAVLVDLAHRRFYFFFIELWPQEVYYFTGLLILAALILFLMNAVAGRLWCGYLCPQTVWTDLFMAVERLIEGDRRERMRKDAGPLTLERLTEKLLKHSIWLAIAWWTGGAWVLYFADAPTLVVQLATFSAPMVAYGAIAVLTFTTYVLAGHMREQLCLYMCPWPRIQAALTDENALNVTYRYDRGEPRYSLKKAELLRATDQPAGDCIDCGQCVVVCPTGVDIREGANLGCIQCGLCIDACDTVMHKVGRPPRLIAYDTDINIKRRSAGLEPIYRLLRPRTLLYSALIALIGAVMILALFERAEYGIAVIHDRNPLYVRLTDGAVRNGYTVRFVNKEGEMRRFELKVSGLEDAIVEIVGTEHDLSGREIIEVGPDQTREVRVLVSTRTKQKDASVPLTFTTIDENGALAASVKDFFRSP